MQQGTKQHYVMSYTMIRTVVSNLSVASHSPFETSWSCSIYTFYGNIDHPVINTWSLMKNWWQFNTFKVIFRLTNARSVLMIQGNHLKCRFSYQNLSLLNICDIMCLCWRNLPYHISVKTLIAFFFTGTLMNSCSCVRTCEEKDMNHNTEHLQLNQSLHGKHTHTGHQCRWYSHRYYINQSNAAAEKHFHTSNWLLENHIFWGNTFYGI